MLPMKISHDICLSIIYNTVTFPASYANAYAFNLKHSNVHSLDGLLCLQACLLVVNGVIEGFFF